MVQAEAEAKAKPVDQEDRGPMGLLKRLTVGLTRREEEPARLEPAQPREPRLRQPAPEARRIASQDPQLYAPRRGQLDEHGRLAPQARSDQDDDQLGDSGVPSPSSELKGKALLTIGPDMCNNACPGRFIFKAISMAYSLCQVPETVTQSKKP